MTNLVNRPVPGYPLLEAVCGYCEYYTHKKRKPDYLGWSFCRFWNDWFPDQFTDNPAGLRTCEQWVRQSMATEDIKWFLKEYDLTDPRHLKILKGEPI